MLHKTFLLLLVLMSGLLSACLMNEEQMTEEELMRKHQQFIDTAFVKDLHVDTTYEIRTTKINDSVTVFDTLTIVRSITKNDTINNVTTLNKVDSVYSVRYDTIYRTTHLDTFRTISLDTVRNVVYQYDTLRTVIKDTLVSKDTIVLSSEPLGILSHQGEYYTWYRIGTLQVVKGSFATTVKDSLVSSLNGEINPSNQLVFKTTAESAALDKFLQDSIGTLDLYQHANVKFFKASCPVGYRVLTNRDSTYIKSLAQSKVDTLGLNGIGLGFTPYSWSQGCGTGFRSNDGSSCFDMTNLFGYYYSITISKISANTYTHINTNKRYEEGEKFLGYSGGVTTCVKGVIQ